MAVEGENRASQPDIDGQEPELPDSEVGEHAHRLIGGFKHALITTPEFLDALGDKFFTQQSPDKDNRFRFIHFIKGDAHYVVHYEEIYNEKNGRGREKLWIERSSLNRDSHDEQLAEDISLWSHTTNNGNQIEKGYINIARSRINSDVFWNTRIGANIPCNTQIAIQAVEDFLATNFSESQSQPSTRNPQAESTPTEEPYSPPSTYNSNRWTRLDVETKPPPNFDSNSSRKIEVEDKPQSDTPQEKPATRIPRNNRWKHIQLDNPQK